MGSAVSETGWAIVLSEIIKSATSLFLNGICILLALQACYFLNRRESSRRGVLICAMIVACAFAIVQMCYQVAFTTMLVRLLHVAEIAETANAQKQSQASILHLAQIKSAWDRFLLLTNNFAADSLFIYRCYLIWGQSCHKRLVIGIPMLLLLFTTIFGVATTGSSFPAHLSADYALVVELSMIATNILLTGLTAGRIWWKRRHLRVIGETKLIKRHNTAIAMLLESSALYLVFIFTFLLAQNLGGPSAFDSSGISVLCGASGQLMNLIPALVIVRVSFARSVDVDPTAGNMGLVSPVY
ncbi:hypothetical protein MVEN_00367200 [Mycena venus]|uniref:Uncharacterized protein n=1 Tax=Mycena venus TaxID=2733690 RepID=A0A8H6YTL6_9AGAR|nr:hypothetical protein MVEN_00367200 [Mycena venus]